MSTVMGELHERGIVRLPGAVGRAEIDAIADTVWGYVERHTTVRRDDPRTWEGDRPQVSFKPLKGRQVFAALLDAGPVRGALDEVFGPGGWRRPRKHGAQVLLNHPAPGPWSMPAGWHVDTGFDLPTWPVPAVKIFGFFGEVGPCGGGTMLLAGSHRLVERYAPTLAPHERGGNATSWGRFMRQDPWLAELARGGSEEDGRRDLLGVRHDVDGIEVEAVELTGEPGDMVLTHLHTFHCASPNRSAMPRQMLGVGLYREPG